MGRAVRPSQVGAVPVAAAAAARARRQGGPWFRFAAGHPQAATHGMRLRAKPVVPQLLGGRLPGIPWSAVLGGDDDRDVPRRGAGSVQRAESRFAAVYMTLFAPWNADGLPQHGVDLPAFAAFAAEQQRTEVGVARLKCIENCARGLGCKRQRKEILMRFRSRDLSEQWHCALYPDVIVGWDCVLCVLVCIFRV